jgi:hypothetical protein
VASVVASEEAVSHHIGQPRTIWYRRASVELTAGSVGSLDPPGHTVEMNMPQNVGTTDRAVRVVVAVAATLVAGWAGFGTAAGIVLLAIAAVLLVTGASGFCPLYVPFHLSTCRHGTARTWGHGQRTSQ